VDFRNSRPHIRRRWHRRKRGATQGLALAAAGSAVTGGAIQSFHDNRNRYNEAKANRMNAESGIGAEGAGKVVDEQHHQLPQQFKERFENAGLDIEDYKISLDRSTHRLKPDGLHTGNNSWNKQWNDFFRQFPNVGKPEILNQLDKMQKAFGLK
jgi:hypothetical protein